MLLRKDLPVCRRRLACHDELDRAWSSGKTPGEVNDSIWRRDYQRGYPTSRESEAGVRFPSQDDLHPAPLAHAQLTVRGTATVADNGTSSRRCRV